MRKLDELGRLVLPIEVRDLFEWAEGFDIALSPDGKQIILSPVRGEKCSCCREHKETLHRFGPLQLCDDCVQRIRNTENR